MVVSCGQDEVDSVTNFGEFTGLEQVKVRFNDDNTNPVLFEGETTSFRLGMPAAVDGKVTVEMEVTSTDGSVEAVFVNPVVFERGQSEIVYDFTPTDDGIDESGEVYTLTIKDITVELANGSTEFFTFAGDNTRTITIKDVPTPVVTTPGDVQVVLTWGEASRDMDLFLVTGDQNLSGTVIDSSLGFTTTESTTLPGSQADGIISVYINQWAFTADVDYTMTFTFPDGQQKVYDSTVTQDSFVFTMDKTTSGSDVTYNITEL